MTTKEHPHAEVLRAIADGVPLSEFEVTWGNKVCWEPVDEQLYSFLNDESSQVRRKPQYIMVNGFKVPKPLDVMPKDDSIFTPHFSSKDEVSEWKSEEYKSVLFEKGVAHSTREAAIAHAKAMLGIDPEYFK